MNKKLILLIFLILFSSLSVIFADEYRYSFIIDQEGNTKLRYQEVTSISEYGMYLPSYNEYFYPPEGVTNLEFYDNDGKITPKYIGSEDGYDIYLARIPDVYFLAPYEIGYQYDLPEYTTVRYMENYHFEYPWYLDANSEIITSVCIPSSANSSPVDYDSSPEEYTTTDYPFKQYTYIPIPKYVPFELPQFPGGDSSISVCPDGYKKTDNLDFELGISTNIKSSFSMSNNKIDNFTYESGNIKVIGPSIYQSVLERNIKSIETILPNINSSLNLDTPSNYTIYFVSDTDNIFRGYGDEYFFVSYEDGTIYIKTSVINSGGDEFIQVNLLRAIINCAILDTYGENSDNSWWSLGAQTNMAVKLMKESGLPYSELQDSFDYIKEGISQLSSEEIVEAMNGGDYQILIYSSIVDEIENMCFNHIIKLNGSTRLMSNLAFTSDKQFNNFLIYNLNKDCSQDISGILDKYKLEHDDVIYVSNKYVKIFDKIKNLDDIGVNKLIDAKNQLIQANDYLNKGNVQEALELIEKTEAAYSDILNLVMIHSKITDLNPKIQAIPEEIRPPSILSAINKIDETEDLILKNNTAEALIKVNEAAELYDAGIKEMGGILQEYTDVKTKINAVPGIFYFPAKIFAKQSLNSSVGFIKNNNYENARKSFASANFWSNNAVTFGLLFYIIVIGGAIFCYFKFVKSKKIKQIKHHKNR